MKTPKHPTLIRRFLQARQKQLQAKSPVLAASLVTIRRACGNPNCRCARGQLHAAWVITRKSGKKGWTYMVPVEERGRLRQLTQEYRQYVRGRAVLSKRHAQILALVDQLAEQRTEVWPPAEKLPPKP